MKTIILIIIIIHALIFQPTRIQFVETMVDIYEYERGEVQYSDCPFVDGDDISCKAFAARLTAGSSATTFSPNDKVEPYQLFLFAGKLLQSLGR